jgi:hypothetical protein
MELICHSQISYLIKNKPVGVLFANKNVDPRKGNPLGPGSLLVKISLWP